MSTVLRRALLPVLLLVAPVAAMSGCGDDPPAAGGEGTVHFRLGTVQGVFIEGFEVGVRFTDGEGQVLKAINWTDFIAGTGRTDLDAYYTSVLDQPVPSGRILVEADFRMSIGGPVEPPDLEAAAFPCQLEVDVPDGGEVTVEMAFTNEPGCLSVVDE